MNKENKYNILGFSVIIVIWEVASAVFEQFVPSFFVVVINTYKLLLTYKYWGHISSSLKIIFVGFLISVILGIVIGILVSFSKKIRYMILPIIDLIRGIPALSLLPLFILFFGIGLMPKLLVVVWISWTSILFNVIEGLNIGNKSIIEAGRIGGASKTQIYIFIKIPLALPNFVTGMRIGISYSWLSIIAAEMIGGSEGLGYAVQKYANTFRIEDVFSTIIVIALLNLAFNTIFGLLHKKVSEKYKII